MLREHVRCIDQLVTHFVLLFVCLFVLTVLEVDMFRLLTQDSWPEEWWLDPLTRYAAGDGCAVQGCPGGFVPGGGIAGCCEAVWSSGCGEDCAKASCAARKWVWQNVDPNHHPYVCCPPTN
jgi:hypothetical protein